MADKEKAAALASQIVNALNMRNSPTVNTRSMLVDPQMWTEIAGFILDATSGEAPPAEPIPPEPEEQPDDDENADTGRIKRGRRK